jgi:SPFH domain / Band 7 family
MKLRIILTAISMLAWSAVNFIVQSAEPLISSQTSVAQLQDSNNGYFEAKFGSLFNGNGLSIWILFAIIIAIWFKPIVNFIKKSPALAILIFGIGFGCMNNSAYASFGPIDDVEFVQIKANQTAFLVPQQGKTLEGQGAFDSAAFLAKNKIAEKRIQIPHQLLPKKGLLTQNMYIPSSVLYVVTREPYVRQWTKEATRGTSSKDEGFYLESKESINVDFGVSIGAHITIEDSATYLFFFGVSDVVNQGDSPEFPSVVYAQSLANVMDKVVHQRVQTLLAGEFGSRSLTDCMTQKIEIMNKVEKQVISEFAKVGITIEYVGYASALNYDAKIQESIDKVFIAEKEAAAATNQLEAMKARSMIADIEIKKGIAQALSKWNGQIPNLPNFVVVPENFLAPLKETMKNAIPAPLK